MYFIIFTPTSSISTLPLSFLLTQLQILSLFFFSQTKYSFNVFYRVPSVGFYHGKCFSLVWIADSFVNIIAWHLWSSTTSRTPVQALWLAAFSLRNQLIVLMSVPLYVTWSFCLVAFNLLYFFWTVSVFDILWCGEFLFGPVSLVFSIPLGL